MVFLPLAGCICRRAAGKGCHTSYSSSDSPDPSKTRPTVCTVLSIHIASLGQVGTFRPLKAILCTGGQLRASLLPGRQRHIRPCARASCRHLSSFRWLLHWRWSYRGNRGRRLRWNCSDRCGPGVVSHCPAPAAAQDPQHIARELAQGLFPGCQGE